MSRCQYPDDCWECPWEAESYEDLCIFHLPASKKDPDKFWRHFASYYTGQHARLQAEQLDTIRNRGGGDLLALTDSGPERTYTGHDSVHDKRYMYRGFVFPKHPEGISLRGLSLIAPDFSRARFAGPTSFSKALLIHQVTFEDAVFDDVAGFRAAQFNGSAEFDNARFKADADFRNSAFVEDARFMEATFDGDARFARARFDHRVIFWRVQFGGRADFTDDRDGKPCGDADFAGSLFEGVADFSGRKFGGSTNFAGARFKNFAVFDGAHFTDDAKFVERTAFEDETRFSAARFDGKADFSDADFRGKTSFRDAQFAQDLTFERTSLSGTESCFRDAEFNGQVSFRRTVVDTLLDMSYVKLRGQLLFDGTRLSSPARVLLWGLNFAHGTSRITMERGHQEGELVEPAGQVVFRDINDGMNRVSFLHTDILTDRLLVRFSNVGWEKNTWEFIFDAKFVSHDLCDWPKATGLPIDVVNRLPELFFADPQMADVRTRKEEDDRQAKALRDSERLVEQDVERIAREIRRSTEEYGSYPDAGDFHVAEMEFRRARAQGFYRAALRVYKAISMYGESPPLALQRLAALWLFFSNVYFWVGFGNKLAPFWTAWSVASPMSTLKRAGWALLHGLVNIVPGYFRFQREALASWHHTLLLAVEALAGAGILALFLLAVRRRFRR